MTLIDNISFRFRMTDELFARELYADWDGFCQRCVTDVLEEFFYRYDKKDIYMEIGRLDLDLGGIPQEEFYGSFPCGCARHWNGSSCGRLKRRKSCSLHSRTVRTTGHLSKRTNPVYIPVKNGSKIYCIIWNTASACPNGMCGISTCMRNCGISGIRIMRRGCCS